MTPRRVVVTGAGGYIGSVLTLELLRRRYQVVAVDRFLFGRKVLAHAPGLTVLIDDIRTLGEEVFEGVDAVIDLAALSNDPAGELDAATTWSINHAGRVRVATLAKRAGVARYILPSSCSIYGFQEGVMNEGSGVNPLTTYAKANYAAENDSRGLADDDFCVVALRQATVFGYSPRMRFDLAINGMVRGIFLNGLIPILRDGTQWRPFVHVRDAVRLLATMIEAPRGLIQREIFNVGANEHNVRVIDLAKMIAEAIEVPFEFEWYGSPDHRSYRVDFSKITEALGFECEVSIMDGAREVVNKLKDGTLDPNDPTTITVEWYRHLRENEGITL